MDIMIPPMDVSGEPTSVGRTSAVMHISRAHEDMLPEGVTPMLMPDTQREAELLVLMMDCRLYPSVAHKDDQDGGLPHVKEARLPYAEPAVPM